MHRTKSFLGTTLLTYDGKIREEFFQDGGHKDRDKIPKPNFIEWRSPVHFHQTDLSKRIKQPILSEEKGRRNSPNPHPSCIILYKPVHQEEKFLSGTEPSRVEDW